MVRKSGLLHFFEGVWKKKIRLNTCFGKLWGQILLNSHIYCVDRECTSKIIIN